MYYTTPCFCARGERYYGTGLRWRGFGVYQLYLVGMPRLFFVLVVYLPLVATWYLRIPSCFVFVADAVPNGLARVGCERCLFGVGGYFGSSKKILISYLAPACGRLTYGLVTIESPAFLAGMLAGVTSLNLAPPVKARMKLSTVSPSAVVIFRSSLHAHTYL